MTTRLTVAPWKWENDSVKRCKREKEKRKRVFLFPISSSKQTMEVINEFFHFPFSSHFHKSKLALSWKEKTLDSLMINQIWECHIIMNLTLFLMLHGNGYTDMNTIQHDANSKQHMQKSNIMSNTCWTWHTFSIEASTILTWFT